MYRQSPVLSPSDLIATKIVQAERKIIGDLAWGLAAHVYGISVDKEKMVVHVTGSIPRTLKELIGYFARLFGGLAREDCRNAAAPYVHLLPLEQLPRVLRNIPPKPPTPWIGLRETDPLQLEKMR